MPNPLLSSFAKFKNAMRAQNEGKAEQLPSMRLFELQMLGLERRVANESAIRGSCNVAYLGNNAALCRVLGRYKAYVDTTDIGLCSHLMLDGYWEMWVTEVLASMIRPGMVVADIGANIGYFTLLMAELVGPAGRVHAFEPNPRLVELLNKSLMVNGFSRWVDVHQTALGDRGDHSVTLVVPPNTPMNAYILPPGADAPPEGVEVAVARLDSREDWRAIELAKIDVEGAEELIWAGTQGLLESGKLRTVVLEFNPHRYGEARAFLERLSGHGFALNHLTLDAGIVPIDMDSILSRSGPEDIMLVLKR
jgi:FkbM family methyltransferase